MSDVAVAEVTVSDRATARSVRLPVLKNRQEVSDLAVAEVTVSDTTFLSDIQMNDEVKSSRESSLICH